MADRVIQSTSDDAVRAKQAAVQAGYYQDPFISAFPNSNRPVQPIIKRGTHARVKCLDRAIASFLQQQSSSETTKQVVVLGAGKDTTFFRLQAGLLMDQSPLHQLLHDVRWFEIDHEYILRDKADVIKRHSAFGAKLKRNGVGESVLEFESSTTEAFVGSFCLVPHDLRDDPQRLLHLLLSETSFDCRSPTLFVLECVQMYVPEASSRSLLQALSQHCPDACIVLYEPILGKDAFGHVMEDNLTKAGMATKDSCLLRIRTLAQHMKLLEDAGFPISTGCDMWTAYETVLTPEQRRLANSCEFLDEIEEWMMIMRHYCLIAACTKDSKIGKAFCKPGKKSPLGFVEGRCEQN